MTNGSVLIFPPGPDIVGQAIKDVTGGPAHIAICVGGFVFDDTVWHQAGRFFPVSGVRIAAQDSIIGTHTVRDPVTPWTLLETKQALQAAIDQVNLRRHYNIPLLVADAVIYPLRGLWKFLHWAPFEHSKEYVCSSFAGMVYRATGRDPWPGLEIEELTPEDFVMAKEWEDA